MKQERKYVLVKKTVTSVIPDYSCQQLEQSSMGPIKLFFSLTPATRNWMDYLFQS